MELELKRLPRLRVFRSPARSSGSSLSDLLSGVQRPIVFSVMFRSLTEFFLKLLKNLSQFDHYVVFFSQKNVRKRNNGGRF